MGIRYHASLVNYHMYLSMMVLGCGGLVALKHLSRTWVRSSTFGWVVAYPGLELDQSNKLHSQSNFNGILDPDGF